ncbi:hypothetical protein FF38_14431 [Lucilia cuprina]|uniref:Uncharacterized protein n=1 Tax=Lucilia cuprina TaxID=7375 RepID=A0A0L0CG40_LUCCU|nr:hypothetical protein FF38_14431 [Lucilia cuprina]
MHNSMKPTASKHTKQNTQHNKPNTFTPDVGANSFLQSNLLSAPSLYEGKKKYPTGSTTGQLGKLHDDLKVAEDDDTLLDSDPEDVDVTLVYDPDFGDDEGNIRSCILAKSHLNIFILSDYSDEDTVAAAWESDNSNIWLLSSYMAHDHGDQPGEIHCVRKTNWEVHKATLNDILPTVPTIESRSDIDLAVNWISSSISVATNRDCRKGKPPLWDPEIAKTRRLCRKLFNEAKRTGIWSRYKSKVNEFKNQIRVVFVRSCLNLLSVPSYIQKSDGNWTAGSQETLELLLNTHFPGCIPIGDSAAYNLHGIELGNTTADVSIDDDIIRWAIRSFDTYKSPGLMASFQRIYKII